MVFILVKELACLLIMAPFLLINEIIPEPELPPMIIEETPIAIEETPIIIEEPQEVVVEKPIEPIKTNKVTSRSGIERDNNPILKEFEFPLHIEYIVTSKYGNRGEEFHTGVDMAVPEGTEIYAPYDGTVIKLQSKTTGYGNLIVIEHEEGILTYYAHLSSFEVELEDTVTKGELIGYTGSTGRSTGPHLHYEVRVNGKTTNPLKTGK